MRLNTVHAYALDLLVELHRAGGFVSGDRLSSECGIPLAFAKKTLSRLRRAGIVTSAKGRGFKITAPLCTFTALHLTNALGKTGAATDRPSCELLESKINSALSGIPLEAA